MKRTFTFIASCLLCLTGCSNASTDAYKDNKPVLDIRQYLNGEIKSSGVFIDYKNQAQKYFDVTMHGQWQGNDGTFKEDFVYNDGTTSSRIWTIKFTDGYHFTATAHDVVGIGHGEQQGNAVTMKYTLRVPHGNSTIDLGMQDWMFLVNDRTLISRTQMTKFGIPVGEVIMSFHKE